MTVADLIAALQKLSPDLYVIVDGYEGGYDDPVLDTHTIWVAPSDVAFETGMSYGAYGDAGGDIDEFVFEAIVIHRGGHA